MRKTQGHLSGKTALYASAFFFILLILLQAAWAFDEGALRCERQASPLAAGNMARWDELCGFSGAGSESAWACPRCGARDNPAWVRRCRCCTYGRHNPEAYLFRPVKKGCITGRFTRSHPAIDFGVPEGTPVFAAEDGIVVGASSDRWAGKVLKIEHTDGVQTLYGHLGRILVPLDGCVKRGDVIAQSGNTGFTTGPHLHFEVFFQGKQDNPLSYLAPW